MDEIENFGKGALREDIPDPRDFQWGRDVGSAATPFDWEKGYDVEEEVSKVLGVPFKLPVKNQNGSSSCGGQAWSYYGQILDTLTDKVTEEKSAKFIYSQTHVGTGGSDGRANSTICIKQGWGNEADTPSYENNLPPSEAFMINNDISDLAKTNAYKDRGLAYANVLDREIENIATAIRDNYGCIMGVTGTNNGTWRSSFPIPPTTYANSWNHWLYFGKLKILNGKKYFGCINSWGDDVGEKGWQWLSEDYIKTFILGYPVIFSVWTMVAKSDVIIPVPVFTRTLKFGMSGADVRALQSLLKDHGFFTHALTNYFGNITLKAVLDFQVSKELKADGVVGKLTVASLITAGSTPPQFSRG